VPARGGPTATPRSLHLRKQLHGVVHALCIQFHTRLHRAGLPEW
jgi:hypothetical protein